MPSLISVCRLVIGLDVTVSLAISPAVNFNGGRTRSTLHGEGALIGVVACTHDVHRVGAVGESVQGGGAARIRRCSASPGLLR